MRHLLGLGKRNQSSTEFPVCLALDQSRFGRARFKGRKTCFTALKGAQTKYMRQRRPTKHWKSTLTKNAALKKIAKSAKSKPDTWQHDIALAHGMFLAKASNLELQANKDDPTKGPLQYELHSTAHPGKFLLKVTPYADPWQPG